MIAVLAGILWLDWSKENESENILEAFEYPSRIIGLPISILMLALAVLAFLEIARLATGAGVNVLKYSGILCTSALGTFPFWWQYISADEPTAQQLLLVLAIALLLIFAEQMIRFKIEDAFRRISSTLLAFIYLGSCGAIVLALRLSYGVGMLIVFLAAVKFTDIGAYFTGSFIGRHKMIPWLSPGKSWEGLVGGLATAAGISMLAVWILQVEILSLWQAAIFGVVIGLAGQFGDLCESLLKRSAQQKDSGALVPEFGGVLDIIDSPLLAAPIAYLFILAVS